MQIKLRVKSQARFVSQLVIRQKRGSFGLCTIKLKPISLTTGHKNLMFYIMAASASNESKNKKWIFFYQKWLLGPRSPPHLWCAPSKLLFLQLHTCYLGELKLNIHRPLSQHNIEAAYSEIDEKLLNNLMDPPPHCKIAVKVYVQKYEKCPKQ